jgi:hypothetical protein
VPERLFARINGVLPGLIDKSLRKQLAVIRRYAEPGGTDVPPVRLSASFTSQEPR